MRGGLQHRQVGSTSRSSSSDPATALTAIPQLPVLDAATLSQGQLAKCERLFDDFRSQPMLPANEAYRDETRKALDEAVLFELLGLPAALAESLELLRLKWCSEPSVHGGKPTRPQHA